jgi:Zn-finger nucleic acid-binding protein
MYATTERADGETGGIGPTRRKPANDRQGSRTWGDSTSQKYVSGGEIQVVPHDRRPRCYGVWDFRFKDPACPGCGATLGRDVKVPLDTDVCPSCEGDDVSMTTPFATNAATVLIPTS